MNVSQNRMALVIRFDFFCWLRCKIRGGRSLFQQMSCGVEFFQLSAVSFSKREND